MKASESAQENRAERSGSVRSLVSVGIGDETFEIEWSQLGALKAARSEAAAKAVLRYEARLRHNVRRFGGDDAVRWHAAKTR